MGIRDQEGSAGGGCRHSCAAVPPASRLICPVAPTHPRRSRAALTIRHPGRTLRRQTGRESGACPGLEGGGEGNITIKTKARLSIKQPACPGQATWRGCRISILDPKMQDGAKNAGKRACAGRWACRTHRAQRADVRIAAGPSCAGEAQPRPAAPATAVGPAPTCGARLWQRVDEVAEPCGPALRAYAGQAAGGEAKVVAFCQA